MVVFKLIILPDACLMGEKEGGRRRRGRAVVKDGTVS